MQMAAFSNTRVRPSTSAGSLPAGLIFRYSGFLCAFSRMRVCTISYSTPASSSIHFATCERLCGSKYSFSIEGLLSADGGSELGNAQRLADHERAREREEQR